MGRARQWAWLVALGVLLASGSCRKSDEAAAESPDPKDRALALHVVDEAPGLSFRYLDPRSHAAKTALRRADVPEAARRWVMVYTEGLPAEALAAGEMVMADLSEARADGTYPARVVSTVGHEAHAAVGKASPSATPAADGATATAAPAVTPTGKVLLFVTTWCPHCRRAEAWFKGRGVPFTKLDVERDAGARELLQKLFRDNQVPEEYAGSVPVIAIDGKVLLGFDEAEVAKALQ